MIGTMEERLCAFRDTLHRLAGSVLFPIGQTHIFEDDGLGVHVDLEGRIYVDGPTGDDPPHDYRIELISPSIDHFFHRIFLGPRVPPLAAWDYSPGRAATE